MKGVLAFLLVIILVIVFAAAAYYVVPVMVEKGTAGLRAELSDMKQRVEKIEEGSKVAALPPDADAQKIISKVNSLSASLSALEAAIGKQKTETDEVLRKQAETLEKSSKDAEGKLQRIRFGVMLAGVRNHLLKAQMELRSRNIGTAKTEIEQVSDMVESLKMSATEEQKKTVEDLQASLRKARSEMDTDVAAAADRIELLWREISKLARKV